MRFSHYHLRHKGLSYPIGKLSHSLFIGDSADGCLNQACTLINQLWYRRPRVLVLSNQRDTSNFYAAHCPNFTVSKDLGNIRPGHIVFLPLPLPNTAHAIVQLLYQIKYSTKEPLVLILEEPNCIELPIAGTPENLEHSLPNLFWAQVLRLVSTKPNRNLFVLSTVSQLDLAPEKFPKTLLAQVLPYTEAYTFNYAQQNSIQTLYALTARESPTTLQQLKPNEFEFLYRPNHLNKKP